MSPDALKVTEDGQEQSLIDKGLAAAAAAEAGRT